MGNRKHLSKRCHNRHQSRLDNNNPSASGGRLNYLAADGASRQRESCLTKKMMLDWFDIDWAVVGYNLTRLMLAYILALPIAWNRERHVRSAGLRTFPLVAVASCGFMLQGMSVLDSTDAESRVMYGIITGIGFIGGGAILKDKSGVSGTATAASIWNTGAIGTAVAWRRYEIALLLSFLNFLTLAIGSYLKRKVDKSSAENH